MKLIILVPDGAADYKSKETGKTPLEVAVTPNMDAVAASGLLGQTKTCPADLEPGSDVANMSILGYDPHEYYTGRGPLEALAMGVELEPDDLAFRCNFVTIEDGIMADYSAGHITSAESAKLIKTLNNKLSNPRLRFYPGISYRHLMVIKEGDPEISCTPPHDITGEFADKHFPSGSGSKMVKKITDTAVEILREHPVNIARTKAGERPASDIWLWGQGIKPSFPTFKLKYHMSGAVISAVDLVKGLGCAAGLEVLDVPGATGYFDTDYNAKAKAAINALKAFDMVYVHVEAPDEAGHEGNEKEKILALERFDKLVVGQILKALPKTGNHRLVIIPDHATPLKVRTHTKDPVPFAVSGTGIAGGGSNRFTEAEAQASKLRVKYGYELISYILKL